ncbi:LMBR1-like membrane protein-domain-containing protein [Syncephalastrum racemosum]|uniref:LMBR1-like membrane protein-domain-containing protein n=1 Tax=Syncephalastrum racemosum TaxID=13706 RepID=A0A1X2HLX3_SYNRA|nr:LMBR1-like membrane protein-domain-containing protein [Syncephalastrum racemosum]
MDGEIPIPPSDPGEADGTNYVPVILGTLSLFGLVVGLVSHYSNIRSQPWYVSTVCIIGWCFPFWIVLLLPIDMASTMYDNCEGECKVPFAHVSQSFLYVAWRTLYWTSFCLTWMMIPMMQAYVNTGDFSFIRRLKSAAQVNLRFYSIYLVVGIIGLVYLVFGSGYTTREKIQGFVMAMANSWGLFLAIVLMGYGLVAVPRRLWLTGSTQRHLRQLYANASRVKEECIDSELEFDEIAQTMNAIANGFRHSRQSGDIVLRKQIDQMVEKFPFVLDPEHNERQTNIPRVITEEYLVKLTKDMIIAARLKDRKVALWKNLLNEAFYLQDIIANKKNTDHKFHSTVRPLPESSRWTEIKSSLEWWWILRLEPVLHKALAIICVLISICILWSELVFNIQNPTLSIVALGLKACGFNYAAVELTAFFTLTFMCLCVYTSLFKVRFFNLYLLIPNHHTDENSMLWFTGYLCKMMAPLCYNYINLAGNASSSTNSVFNQFMGHADLVPFLGTTFIDWFPVVILIPALAQLFNIQGRCFGFCGMKDPYQGDDDADIENNDGALSVSAEIADGKALITEERLLLERSLNPELGAQRGLMNRARSALNSYTSKYNRGSRPNSIHSERSLNAYPSSASALASTRRQERDRRVDEILSGRTGTLAPSRDVNRNDEYHANESDEGTGFLSFVRRAGPTRPTN